LKFEQADVPGHVATVRYRSGEYVVYNRSGETLTLANRSIASDESGSWHANEMLSIGPAVSLKLVINGSAAPCPRADTEMLESYQQKRQEERRLKSVQDTEEKARADEERANEKSKTAKKSSGGFSAFVALLLGFVLVGLLVFAGYLVLTSNRRAPSTFNPSGVANQLLQRSSELPPRLVSLLQETQQSVELLDRDMARERLLRLRSELERMKADGVELTIADGDGRVSYEDALHSYINDYLSQLD
jgi:hypothetical protein